MNLTALDILQIVLVALKLTGVITCSWWLVLLPLEISIGLIVFVLAISGLVILLSVLRL